MPPTPRIESFNMRLVVFDIPTLALAVPGIAFSDLLQSLTKQTLWKDRTLAMVSSALASRSTSTRSLLYASMSLSFHALKRCALDHLNNIQIGMRKKRITNSNDLIPYSALNFACKSQIRHRAHSSIVWRTLPPLRLPIMPRMLGTS